MNVKVKNLNLNYGEFSALKDITFDLTDGKIYGLLGRNGAGKTSLLSILASFREATSGSITINGENPFENANLMQQVIFLYDKEHKRVSPLMLTLGVVQQFRPNFDMEYAKYLVELFKLDKNKPISKYSKGMQSAVNVIIGLASRAPITIFDEVYLGMDAPSRDLFYQELLKEQEQHPRIIILSTHLVSEMDYLFDEVIILIKGEVLLHEAYDSLMSKAAMITGNAETVDDFVSTKKTINEQYLGSTKSVTIFGEFKEDDRKIAAEKGLDVSDISLQDLFIQLTKEESEIEANK